MNLVKQKLKGRKSLRRLAVAGLVSCLAACSTLQQSAESVDGWLIDAKNLSSLTASYRVDRKKHYPIASNARLIVESNDDRIEREFIDALAPHFQDVTSADEVIPIAQAGFYVELDKNEKAKRIVIRLTDVSSQQTFDQVRIDFAKPEMLSAQRGSEELDRALQEAAAKIAGRE